MCLIVFALDGDGLTLVANRDEFRARDAAPAAPWPQAPHVVAGRDLRAGGTWLGATADGRWAALTNVRAQDVADTRTDAVSRGRLVADFLTGSGSPQSVAEQAFADRDLYRGFNLLVGHGADAWLASTRLGAPQRLGHGVYGLSNDTLDTPWPKLVRARDAFAARRADGAADAALMDVLRDTTMPPDADLPETGVGLAKERFLATAFIDGPDYGTRVTTVLRIADGAVSLRERTWAPGGIIEGEVLWHSDGARWAGGALG